MYILKVYNSFFWGSTATQIEEIREIEIEEYIDSFDILNFYIDYYKDGNGILNCTGLREFQKIQLIKTGQIEEIIFEGFIYNLQPDFNNVKVVARDYKGLLDAKVLFTDKNYSSQTLDFILNDLLTDLNGRSSGDTNPEAWTYEIDAPATGITKIFDKGLSYFSIFKELGIIANKDWTVKQGKIYFKDILGEDKTSGDNFTELVFDKDAPDENNISNIKVNRYWSLRNIILTSITDTSDATSLNTYGRLENYNDIAGGELTNELSRSSKTQRTHNFDIDYSRINTEVKLGDKIKVGVNTGVEFLDISGDLFITRRKIVLRGNANVILSVDVSEITVKKTSFIHTLNNLQDDVKKLLLQ